MDPALVAIGDRIRTAMPSGMTQSGLASLAQMPPDALSRALNGKRGFSTGEITRLGLVLDVNLHWLLTGEDDPLAAVAVARHDWDPETRTRSNSGREADEGILDAIRQAYADAYPVQLPYSSAIPADSAAVRSRLGPAFVRDFAAVVEKQIGVDVVRVPGLSTDYSMLIGRRRLIVLVAQPYWYRSNWSLAHEIGHLALGHHADAVADDKVRNRREAEANAFAAELLLPEAEMRGIDWSTISASSLMRFLWDAGVSTKALAWRLSTLDITLPETLETVLTTFTTPGVLRHGVDGITSGIELREIAGREQDAAARRFPDALVATLTDRVEKGDVAPDSLAWILGLEVEDLDLPEFTEDRAAENYAAVMADRPAPGVWSAQMSGQPQVS